MTGLAPSTVSCVSIDREYEDGDAEREKVDEIVVHLNDL